MEEASAMRVASASDEQLKSNLLPRCRIYLYQPSSSFAPRCHLMVNGYRGMNCKEVFPSTGNMEEEAEEECRSVLSSTESREDSVYEFTWE